MIDEPFAQECHQVRRQGGLAGQEVPLELPDLAHQFGMNALVLGQTL